MPWLQCRICGKEIFHEFKRKIASPCCSKECREIWVMLEDIKINSIDSLGITPWYESKESALTNERRKKGRRI